MAENENPPVVESSNASTETPEKPPETQPEAQVSPEPEKKDPSPEKEEEEIDLFSDDPEPEKEEPEPEPAKEPEPKKEDSAPPAEREKKEEPEKTSEPKPEKNDDGPGADPDTPIDEDDLADKAFVQAKAVFRQKHGRDPDEFKPEDTFKVSRMAGEIFNGAKAQIEFGKKLMKASKEINAIPANPEEEKALRDAFEDLPHRQAKEIQNAAAAGNFEPMKNFFLSAKKALAENKQKTAQVQAKVAEVKTRVNASKGDASASASPEKKPRNDGLDLFGYEE